MLCLIKFIKYDNEDFSIILHTTMKPINTCNKYCTYNVIINHRVIWLMSSTERI